MRALVIALCCAVGTVAGAQNLALKPIVSGLNQPLGVVNAGDPRLFIVQQGGQIVIWDGTRIVPGPFLDVGSLISCCGEQGLLGLAFDPHYDRKGFFFIYYTRRNGDVVIARYHVSSDPDRADPTSGTIVLTVSHTQFPNHNGGQLQFGPDGYLYIGIGDGGSGGDPNNNAQTLSVLLGKILRIDVSTLPYSVPASNPFRSPVWAYGLRNPWRFTFDRQTGDLWIGDVGQSLYEEIDFQPASSIGGQNYGWRKMEGFHCYNPSVACSDATMTLPILEYSHADGSCSVTGGYRYRGGFQRLRGTYFYADYCSGTIWSATQQSDGTWLATRRLNTSLKITSFGEDIHGELYVVDQNGTIYQLIDQIPQRHRAVSK